MRHGADAHAASTRRGPRPCGALAWVLSVALALVSMLGGGGHLLASEAAPDAGADALIQQARQAQSVAEQQLMRQRLRIEQEQSELLHQLQQAVSASASARSRLHQLQHDASIASIERASRARDAERSATLSRQLIDRALVSAALPASQLAGLSSASPLQRLDAALGALTRRMQALPGRLQLRVTNEAVVGRHGEISTVRVLHLGDARTIALGGDDDHRGVCERSRDGGVLLVVGPRLPESVLPTAMPAGVTGSALALTAIAVDASGHAAEQHADRHRSVRQYLAAGRFFIWPILLSLVIGIMVGVERAVALRHLRVESRQLQAICDSLSRGELDAAQALVGPQRSPLERVVSAGLASRTRSREARAVVMEQALLSAHAQLTRGLPVLALLAGVAPLLGLLGTVTGMIDLFSVIASHGAGAATSLSGGISEALICTQAGMLVAIPLLIAHAWLGRKAERITNALEEAACAVLAFGDDGHALVSASVDPVVGLATPVVQP